MVVVWGGLIYFIVTSVTLLLAMRDSNARTSVGTYPFLSKFAILFKF